MTATGWVLVLTAFVQGHAIDHIAMASREACVTALVNMRKDDTLFGRQSFCLNTQTGETALRPR